MKRIMTILLTLCITLCISAQGNSRPKFDPEKFRKDQETYITKEARLSAREAEALFPIYNEYQDKKRKLQHQQMKCMRERYKTEDEAQKAVTALADLRVQEAKLDATYYKRMAKAVPAMKVMESLKAAERYKHHLMGNFMQRPDGRHRGDKANNGNNGGRRQSK